MPVVHENYFKPALDAFVPRNLWSLSNAFTSAFKQLRPTTQFEATARFGSYLSRVREETGFRPPGPRLLRAEELSDAIPMGEIDASASMAAAA